MIRFGTYLLQNSYGIYHFRISIPSDLRPILGKRELKKSLKTSNLIYARKAAYCYAVNAQVFFEEVRESMAKDIDLSRLSLMTPRYEHGGIKITGSSIEIGPAKTDPNHPNDAKDLLDYLDKLKELIPNAQITVQPTPEENKKPEEAAPSPLFLQNLFESYIQEKKQTEEWSTGKTVRDNVATFNAIIRILGNVTVKEFDVKLARYFKDILYKYPSNVTKRPAYRNLSVPQILKLEIPLEDLLTKDTVRKYLTRISAVFDYAVNHGLATLNPFEKLIPPRKTSKHVKKRDQYTTQELTKLFGTDIYTSHNFKKPHHYWLPLLGLFTGARISELCQLHLEDIKIMNGISTISINEDSDDQSVKTIAGIRLIPIHSKLNNLGFDNYLQSLQRAGEKRLFPDITPYIDDVFKYTDWGNYPSKWFAAHLKKLKIKRPKLVFHSLRHTMITKLDNAKVHRPIASVLTGHEHQRSVHDDYTHGFTIEVLHEEIEKTNFDAVLMQVKPFK